RNRRSPVYLPEGLLADLFGVAPQRVAGVAASQRLVDAEDRQGAPAAQQDHRSLPVRRLKLVAGERGDVPREEPLGWAELVAELADEVGEAALRVSGQVPRAVALGEFAGQVGLERADRRGGVVGVRGGCGGCGLAAGRVVVVVVVVVAGAAGDDDRKVIIM